MKYMITLVLIFILTTQSVLATCDWKTIKETPQGYLYSKECHVEVGRLVRSEPLLKAQIKALNKQITLKDLQFTKQVEITDKWRKTSYSLEDRVIKSYKLSSFNNKLNFVGGFVLAVLSVYAAGQLKK